MIVYCIEDLVQRVDEVLENYDECQTFLSTTLPQWPFFAMYALFAVLIVITMWLILLIEYRAHGIMRFFARPIAWAVIFWTVCVGTIALAVVLYTNVFSHLTKFRAVFSVYKTGHALTA